MDLLAPFSRSCCAVAMLPLVQAQPMQGQVVQAQTHHQLFKRRLAHSL